MNSQLLCGWLLRLPQDAMPDARQVTKGNSMKTVEIETPVMVKITSDGTITPEIEKELKTLATMNDEGIDTSDIPEIIDWSNAVVGKICTLE